MNQTTYVLIQPIVRKDAAWRGDLRRLLSRVALAAGYGLGAGFLIGAFQTKLGHNEREVLFHIVVALALSVPEGLMRGSARAWLMTLTLLLVASTTAFGVLLPPVASLDALSLESPAHFAVLGIALGLASGLARKYWAHAVVGLAWGGPCGFAAVQAVGTVFGAIEPRSLLFPLALALACTVMHALMGACLYVTDRLTQALPPIEQAPHPGAPR